MRGTNADPPAPSATAPAVHIQLLGTPQWQPGAGAPQPLARKDAALLALITLDPEPTRDRVAAWLWPDVALQGARVNLRQRLFKLRQQWGHALVGPDAVLRLHPDLAVDLHQAPLPPQGRLLGDLDYGDLEAFDDWLGVQRTRLQQRQTEAALQQVQALEETGDLATAVERCEALLARDPAPERGWRQLMRLHFLRGDRAAALSTYERFERRLQAELGVTPSEPTVQLRRQIEQMSAPHPQAGTLPASLARPPRLVGRGEVLRRLQQAWDQGRAVLLLGEGGIGKSRVVEDFIRGRAGVLATRVRPGDAATPYAAVAPLLQRAWQLLQAPLPPAQRDELARLLPDIGQAPTHEGRQTLLWQAVESLLAAARPQGLEALALDDLHHADLASLDLLRWLLGSDTLAPLRWVFAARDGGADPATAHLRAWLADAARVEPVELDALGPDEVAELLQSLQLPPQAAAALPSAQALHRHAGGHPFFTLETLKGTLQAAPGAALPLPPSAAALLAHRMQRLSPAAQDLLRMLALAGGELSAELAGDLLGATPLQLAPAWAELEASQLARGGTLAHDLVREVAAGRIPQALRPALHAALAGQMARHPGVPAARLAQHWQLAGRLREAAAAWRAAAQQARRSARLPEMDQCLQHAAELLQALGDAEGSFDARCDALESAVWRGAGLQTLERARALEPQASDAARRARLLALLAQTQMSLLRAADALQTTQAALPLAPPGSAVQNDLISLHGRALALSGRAADALQLLRQACDSAQALGDRPRQLVALSALAHALATAGLRGQALQVQQQAAAMSRQGSDAVELTIHLCNTASAAWLCGEAGLVAEAAGEALPLMDRLGVQGGQRLYTCSLAAAVAVQRGRFDQAQVWLQGFDARARAATGATLQRLLSVTEGWGLLQRGAAQAALQGLAQTAAEGVSPAVEAQARLLQLRALCDLGLDDTAAWLGLQAWLQQHPALADDPLVALEAGRHGDPRAARQRLVDLADGLRANGAPALALSLELVALERLLEFDAPAAAGQARGLLQQMPAGMHPLSHPPQAWAALAQALRPHEPALARHALQQALGWLAAARLPDDSGASRHAFEHDNPRNRAVLQRAAAAG